MDEQNNYKANLRSVYNTIANHFSNTRSHLWAELLAFLPYIPNNAHVIDIGCGNGRLIELLEKKQCTYVGIDQAESLLAEAHKKWPKHNFEAADMSTYHYGRERFDCVFFIASIHHLATTEEQLKLLKRIFTALKPGGKLFITVWNVWQPKYKKYILATPYHHSLIPYSQSGTTKERFYYAFTKTELRQLAKLAGFHINDAWYSLQETRVTRSEGRNICLIATKE